VHLRRDLVNYIEPLEPLSRVLRLPRSSERLVSVTDAILRLIDLNSEIQSHVDQSPHLNKSILQSGDARYGNYQEGRTISQSVHKRVINTHLRSNENRSTNPLNRS
jgi:hypothetical protein